MAMQHLVFQLQAPLASWGEPAVGEFRGSAEAPSHSAIIGLLGAALGLDRHDDAAHAALRDGHGFAVAVLSPGSLLRDYHTAQVPSSAKLKGRPHATRRQELDLPKSDLGTILSTRDYRQNAASLVALQALNGAAPGHSLEELAQVLRRPKFTLYLGRKSCALAAPLWPQVIEAESACSAFERYAALFEAARSVAGQDQGRAPLEPLPPVVRITFDDRVTAGLPADLTVTRKDRLLRRQGWQFGDRNEHVALLAATDVLAPEES